MPRKDSIDAFGAASLIGFALLFAINQVVIKLTNDGIQPVFFAGLRSAGAALLIWAWMVWRGSPPRFRREFLLPGLGIGLAFSFEFVCLFTALDLTTVTRVSVIFYSMPVWLSLIGHFVLPGERLTRSKTIGLALAFAGVAWAILARGGPQGEASLAGDLCALGGALGWAGIALFARGTRLRESRPEMQLMWQLAVSVPILLAASLLFGPFIRDLQPWHFAGMAFQIVVIAAGGFLFWLWVLTIYPAGQVASFSFLSPVFGVALGWLLLGERVGLPLLGAAALVAAGLVLINRRTPPPEAAVPPR